MKDVAEVQLAGCSLVALTSFDFADEQLDFAGDIVVVAVAAEFVGFVAGVLVAVVVAGQLLHFVAYFAIVEMPLPKTNTKKFN